MAFLSQINLSKLFQADYIFELSPAATGLYLYFSIIFGVLIISAIASIFIIRHKKKIYRQLQKRFFIFGLMIGAIGLLLTFFRFEQIPYLGSRLMFLVLTITFILWGAWIGFYIIFTLPKEKKELSKKQKFIKYLPAGRQVYRDRSVKKL